MTDLNTIVSTLSSEEQQQFVKYLEKKNKRNDTKNIQLFQLLVKDELDSKAMCEAIYKSANKVAYHALRKRLYQSLIDFIANSSLEEENSIDMQIIKFILASRTFLINKQAKIAYAILDKAEVLAQEHSMFPILNEIYHTKIQYAYLNPSVDMSSLISKFKTNQNNHFLEEELNMVYAKIRQTLSDITFKGEVLDFQSILNKTLAEHNISPNDSMSFKSLYQLMTIVSISAFVTNDYLKIEPFLLETYSKIKTHKLKDKQLYYHIQIVYMIANTLFRNKKFESSLSYLELMNSLMEKQQKKHFKTFELKYHLLLALNLNYTNQQDEAIEHLETYKQSKHTDAETLLDLKLSLIMCYMQASKFKEAQHIFSKFYHTDKYYTEKAGKEWVIKKSLVEIILYIELGHIDLVESRLLSFKRLYNSYLKQIRQERVISYLKLVSYYYKHPESVTSEGFKQKVETSFTWIAPEQEDIFVMSFYAWLKSKMESKPLYETTLQLVKMARNVK
jgi:tetratricopeptide (TPR) repeat protein